MSSPLILAQTRSQSFESAGATVTSWDDLEVVTEQPAPRRFGAFRFASEVAAEARESPRWMVENLICSDSTLLIGGSGRGKTSVAVSLAVAIATGAEHWLGCRIHHPGGLVAFLIGDPGEDKEAAQRLDALSEDAAVNGVLIAQADSTQTERDAYWSALLGDCLDAGVTVLFVDNALSVMPAGDDVNDASTASKVTAHLNTFVREGIAVVLLHHTSKGNKGRHREGMGARGWDAWARHIVALEPLKGGFLDLRTTKSNRGAEQTVATVRLTYDGLAPVIELKGATTHTGPQQDLLSLVSTEPDIWVQMAQYVQEQGLEALPHTQLSQQLAQVFLNEDGEPVLKAGSIRNQLGSPNGVPGKLRALLDQ